jgi:drug/metabolite transporter (DMT)-like permease
MESVGSPPLPRRERAMSSLKSVVTRERGTLAGDACLVTAAAFGLVMGALALTFMPEGEPPEDTTWVQLLSAVLSLAVVIVGPLVAWRLHGRPLTWIAVLGAVVGGFVLGNVVGILVMLVFVPLVWLVSSVSSSEFGGLIAVLVLVGAAFVALLVWLVADGVRDLPLSRRVHLRLDVVRFISVAVLVIFAIGVALWTARHPGDESGEAIIFAVMAGVGAAMIVTGAEAATSLAAQKKAGTGVPGS